MFRRYLSEGRRLCRKSYSTRRGAELTYGTPGTRAPDRAPRAQDRRRAACRCRQFASLAPFASAISHACRCRQPTPRATQQQRARRWWLQRIAGVDQKSLQIEEEFPQAVRLDGQLLTTRATKLKQAVPGVSRVAVLWQPGGLGERTDKDMLKEVEVAARALEVRLQFVEARGPADFDRAYCPFTQSMRVTPLRDSKS
jgi:hypothetical protein